MKLINIAFVLVYFSLGIWFLIAETNLFEVPRKQQQLLGIVFIVYGIYRSYNIYQRYFKYKEDNRQFTNSYEDDIQ